MDSIINPTQSRSDPYSPTKFLSKVHHQAGAHTPEELAVSLFCEIVPTTAHFSQAISIAVKHYLANERSQDRDEIVRLSASHTKEANIQITSYIRRALSKLFHLHEIQNAHILLPNSLRSTGKSHSY